MAIHISNPILFKSLFYILDIFNSHKQQTDEMLYRLYDPIIWRSLKVYNHTIRGNALTLFINIFPFQLNNGSQSEKDEFIQKQFNELIV